MRFNKPYDPNPKKKRPPLVRRAVVFLVWVVLVCLASRQFYSHPSLDSLDGPYPVVRVVDGDTLILEIDQEQVRVRLIGVDAPESVHPDPERNTPQGKAAAQYAKGLLEGQQVWLEYDQEPLDHYGRTLAYLYLPSGEMVQELLLESGYAQPLEVAPNTKYADRFRALAQP